MCSMRERAITRHAARKDGDRAPSATKGTQARDRPKVPTRQRGERRVKALLEAAELVFADRGYGAASMNAIADRASAPIGSLYQFFPSKESLAEALIRRYTDEIIAAWRGIELPIATSDHLARFALILAHKTLDSIGTQLAFATLDDAQFQLGSYAEAYGRLSEELSAVVLHVEPRLPKRTLGRLGRTVLELLKAAYALERQKIDPPSIVREEIAGIIHGYLQRSVLAAR